MGLDIWADSTRLGGLNNVGCYKHRKIIVLCRVRVSNKVRYRYPKFTYCELYHVRFRPWPTSVCFYESRPT